MSTYGRAPGRPQCSHGRDCYRKNPTHWGEYDHPESHPFLVGSASEPAAQRQKLDAPQPAAAPAPQLNPKAKTFTPSVAACFGSSASSSGAVPLLRSVPVPPGWDVVGGSLLVRAYGQFAPAARVAAFDFDGCLADTPLGGFDPDAWKMQFAHVPAVLRQLADEGHCIVVVTNESMDRYKNAEVIAKGIAKKTGRLDGFAAAVDLPMLVLCATAKDGFRKPSTGCWEHYVSKRSAGVAVDLGASFFVGDAAGRKPPGRKPDHSDSDKQFAVRAGLPFFDEQEFFMQRRPPAPPA